MDIVLRAVLSSKWPGVAKNWVRSGISLTPKIKFCLKYTHAQNKVAYLVVAALYVESQICRCKTCNSNKLYSYPRLIICSRNVYVYYKYAVVNYLQITNLYDSTHLIRCNFILVVTSECHFLLLKQ